MFVLIGVPVLMFCVFAFMVVVLPILAVLLAVVAGVKEFIESP